MISHSKDQFKNNLKNKKNFILFSEFKISNSDPTKFFIEYAMNKNYGFLFESVEKEVLRGRYTICGHTPQIIIKDDKQKLHILTSKSSKSLKNKNPLTEIENLIKNLKFNNSNKVPHMSSAFFGYFGYETIHYVEKNIKTKKER